MSETNQTQTVDIKRHVTRDGDTIFVASLAGGPQQLLYRYSEEHALADGQSYAAKYWRKNSSGDWVAL